MEPLPIIGRIPARQGHQTANALTPDGHFARHLIPDISFPICQDPIPGRIRDSAQQSLSLGDGFRRQHSGRSIEGFGTGRLVTRPTRSEIVARFRSIACQHTMIILIKDQLHRRIFRSPNDFFPRLKW